MNHLTKNLIIIIGTLFLASCSSRLPSSTEQSNFLSNYDRLSEVKTPSGNIIKAWHSDQLNTTQKNKLIFTPIKFKPLNEHNKINEKFATVLLNYTNQQVKKELEKHFELTQTPGPNTLQFAGVITSVSATAEELKPYEVLPVMLVIAGTQLAVGSRDADTNIYFEWKVTDSQTGLPLYEAIRKNSGNQLSNTEQMITLEDLKDAVDIIADEVVPNA
ncbi:MULTISPECIES: DUF3313 domain-containing protein [Providencia]|uniref:DUF3313 domain-containing protein n=1 Tax=Providencia TaxID=586 RepID=UPI00234A9950|nr:MULTISPECIES: DUF3313 domain-containing protein [unclassified Providencia]